MLGNHHLVAEARRYKLRFSVEKRYTDEGVGYMGLQSRISQPRCINGFRRIVGQPDRMLWGHLRWTIISSRGSGSTPRCRERIRVNHQELCATRIKNLKLYFVKLLECCGFYWEVRKCLSVNISLVSITLWRCVGWQHDRYSSAGPLLWFECRSRSFPSSSTWCLGGSSFAFPLASSV